MSPRSYRGLKHIHPPPSHSACLDILGRRSSCSRRFRPGTQPHCGKGRKHTRPDPAHRTFQYIQQGRGTRVAQGPHCKYPRVGRSLGHRNRWRFRRSSQRIQEDIHTESSFLLGCSHKWHFLDRGWGSTDQSRCHSLCLNNGNCCLLQNHGTLNCFGKNSRGTWCHFYCKRNLQGKQKYR